MRVGVLAKYAELSASTRYRFLQYAPALAARGIELELLPFFDDAYLSAKFATGRAKKRHVLIAYARRLGALAAARRFDVLWVHSELLPYQPAWAEALLDALGLPYVYDLDDAIFHQYDQHPRPLVRRLLSDKIAGVMRHARVVLAGSGYLATYARQHARDVRVVPTVVELSRWTARPPRPAHELFEIGWLGSPSTSEYLEAVHPALAKLAAARPVRFTTMGAKPLGWTDVPMRELSWSEAAEVEALHGVDVGIMPLPDTPWARGKCAFKLVQYMACGLPTVSSPVGANLEVVTPETGLFADGVEAWAAALGQLAEDPAKAAAFGAAGRARVEARYSVQSQAAAVADALESAARG